MGNTVNLTKGGVVNLSKHTPGLKNVVVGLGWDPDNGGIMNKMFGRASQTIDCDAGAFLLRKGKLVSEADIVYFGNKNHSSRAVNHMGDNLTGDGDGDDEQIVINLDKLDNDYTNIILFVNIYSAKSKRQNFGQIKNSYIRLVNAETNTEVCRYDISKSREYEDATAVVFGKLVRNNNEWEFEALGVASKADNISDIARGYR